MQRRGCLHIYSRLMKVTDKIEITHEDNMALMSSYEDKYFDLAIVDPPFGIGMSNYKRKGNIKFDQTKKWDNCTPDDKYFKELFRVSKNQIIFGGNYFTNYLKPSKGWLFWDKKQNGNLQIGELAWTSFDRMKYFLREWQWDRRNKIHPTQKPYQLYEFCLMNYAKESDKILDTHLGSGSIALACHNLGFELTACELDKEYYDASIKRIKDHISQQRLF